MNLKKLFTSICMASFLTVFTGQSVRAIEPHLVNDSQADSLLVSMLGEEISAVILKISDLAQFIKRNASMGDLAKIVSQLDLDGVLGESFASLSDSFSGLKGAVDTAKGAYDQAKGAYDQAKGVYDQAKGAYDEAKGVYDKAYGQVKGAYDQAMNTYDEVKGKASGLVGEGKNALSKLQKDATDKANKYVSDAIGDAKNQVKSLNQEKGSDTKNAQNTKISKETKTVGNISVPKELQGFGFENAMKDPQQMSSLIVDELLPPVTRDEENPLDDAQKFEREKRRMALRNAAVADAYALAVATQHEGSAAKENSIEATKERAGNAETIQEKTAASLDIALARVAQLVRGNEIAAMKLRLIAADAIGTLPRDF